MADILLHPLSFSPLCLKGPPLKLAPIRVYNHNHNHHHHRAIGDGLLKGGGGGLRSHWPPIEVWLLWGGPDLVYGGSKVMTISTVVYSRISKCALPRMRSRHRLPRQQCRCSGRHLIIHLILQMTKSSHSTWRLSINVWHYRSYWKVRLARKMLIPINVQCIVSLHRANFTNCKKLASF